MVRNRPECEHQKSGKKYDCKYCFLPVNCFLIYVKMFPGIYTVPAAAAVITRKSSGVAALIC